MIPLHKNFYARTRIYLIKIELLNQFNLLLQLLFRVTGKSQTCQERASPPLRLWLCASHADGGRSALEERSVLRSSETAGFQRVH